ncbi:MAG: tetratricopeptide repeat protein [Paracoccaceae bacterium]
MKAARPLHNRILTAILPVFLACALVAGPVWADDSAKLNDLFARLPTADAAEAGRIEAEIRIIWSKSGSAAMDLLLKRGDQAMALGNIPAAIEHFTALVDHDPGFVEGWNARASAYYATGDIGPALADLNHVLLMDPRNFDAIAGLARILEESGFEEKALQAYRAAQAIHPHLAEVNDAIARLSKSLEGQEL